MFFIDAHKIGKRFSNEWIFRNLTYTFEEGKRYALVGPNGSGKSTLLKCLSGIMALSEGKISYSNISPEHLYRHINFVAPYSELPEEFTLEEFLKWYHSIKPFTISVHRLAEQTGLERSWGKPIKFFSSGMKQKLKLAIAFYSHASILMLDEPTSNLDEQNINWYNDLLKKNNLYQILIVASNIETEILCCDEKILLQNFK
ncbi:MAG: ABC transporter ATP-binding protein [Cytophagales bacterium]|nr:ABC transporter ATP-binding protein [Cytophagales bacterium]MDW8383910.1 ABC transporter ATP-binding protein [Flammeovirgaceae bacterium]